MIMVSLIPFFDWQMNLNSAAMPQLPRRKGRGVLAIDMHVHVVKGLEEDFLACNGGTHGASYCGHGYVPLRFAGNVVMRMGTQQQSWFAFVDSQNRS